MSNIEVESNDQSNTQTNMKSTVSKVLGIENSAAWEIVSSDPEHNLYMVHHKPEANLNEYGQIRGIVVDTAAETVVCRSYGYTPTVITNELLEVNGKIPLTDELGTSHDLDPNLMSIKTGFEGTIINIFKHDGVVYRATRKRLDSSRSRWGASRTFMDMYWSLGGPSDETLFDSDSKYSPYCHTFIIVHPEVLIVSKDNVGEGYLVYLGPKQMWSTDYKECPYKQTNKDGSLMVSESEFNEDQRVNAGWIDSTLHVPATVSNMDSNQTTETGKTIFSPNNLTLQEANKHLTFGFYNEFDGWDKLDVRMLPGEFVIVHQLDEEGTSIGMFRVESQAYNWRLGTRDNNPNLKHRFFQLINGAQLKYNTADGKKRYDSLYPTFTPFDSDSIINQIKTDGPYVVWPQDSEYQDPELLMTFQSRLYNIWLAFLNVVPLHSQREVMNYLNYLYAKRGELIGWLRSIEAREHIDSTLFSTRVVGIITAARKIAQDRVKSGKDKDQQGKRMSLKDITRETIRGFINREEGGSLYRLCKEMDVYKREQAEKANSE